MDRPASVLFLLDVCAQVLLTDLTEGQHCYVPSCIKEISVRPHQEWPDVGHTTKRSHISFYFKGNVFKNSLKVIKYLGYFCK